MMTELKNLRRMAGLTQYDLAQESGLPRWKISLIESQQLEPSPTEEVALRRALGKSLENLASKAAEVGHHLSQERVASVRTEETKGSQRHPEGC